LEGLFNFCKGRKTYSSFGSIDEKTGEGMLNRFIANPKHIYLAIGATDFRKQISSLVSMVQLRFEMDPFSEACIFVFCNKKKDSVRILRYDRNGFILAHKKLMEMASCPGPVKNLPRGAW
jgi:hypothetical protein